MLTVFAFAMVLQQAAGSPVVWETPASTAKAVDTPVVVESDLPAWALADPFGWERSQCSPLVSREPLGACQARIRAELSAVLGDQLPAGLRPAGEPIPCLATPGDDGKYPLQCGTPERRVAATVSPTIPDCRPRAQSQGGSVAFVNDCRPDDAQEDGLTLRLGGRD